MDIDLRDRFAMAALQGLLAGDVDAYEDAGILYIKNGIPKADLVAEHAYIIADAMMEARKIDTEG